MTTPPDIGRQELRRHLGTALRAHRSQTVEFYAHPSPALKPQGVWPPSHLTRWERWLLRRLWRSLLASETAND